MTTIAWDGTRLAVDSLVSQDGCVLRYEPKICKKTGQNNYKCNYKYKYFLAGCGCYEDWILFSKFQRESRDFKDNDFVGIELGFAENGEIYLFEWQSNWQHKTLDTESVYAWGSGWKFALAAMEHGKTAIEAVKYATQKDPFTGGDIDYVSCNNPERSIETLKLLGNTYEPVN